MNLFNLNSSTRYSVRRRTGAHCISSLILHNAKLGRTHPKNTWPLAKALMPCNRLKSAHANHHSVTYERTSYNINFQVNLREEAVAEWPYDQPSERRIAVLSDTANARHLFNLHNCRRSSLPLLRSTRGLESAIASKKSLNTSLPVYNPV